MTQRLSRDTNPKTALRHGERNLRYTVKEERTGTELFSCRPEAWDLDLADYSEEKSGVRTVDP